MTAQDLTARDCLHVAQWEDEFVVSFPDDEERSGEGEFPVGSLQQLLGSWDVGDHGVTTGRKRSAPLGGRGRRRTKEE